MRPLAELAWCLGPSARAAGCALHDVIRDFLRGELGDSGWPSLHGALLDAVAVGLPVSGQPDYAGLRFG